MPIIHHQQLNKDSSWAVWKIDESYDEFMAMVNLDDNDNEALDQITHPIKILEWFGSRLTLKYLLNKIQLQFLGIVKDEHAKPFLKDLTVHMSISHCYPYAAAIIHRHHPVGIDIEFPKEKLKRIAHKVFNPTELEFVGDDLILHSIVWSAKEVLYKMNGKKELTFKEHLEIMPFSLQNDATFVGKMLHENKDIEKYNLKFSQIKDHFLVFNL